jgi:hypothetical protein
MRYGQIPEYSIDISDDDDGIQMIQVVIDGAAYWVEMNDPVLDGKTVTRDRHGVLVAR